MPTGPKGQRRPTDVIGNAVYVMRVAACEIEDSVPDDGKDPAAKALGNKGGAARAKAMSPERRAEDCEGGDGEAVEKAVAGMDLE